ncbi:class I lanthipeptide [Taibaiella koreensis]|uniref:class I lanthipeptide n=1 Tax=Taibaiella koreensis TaxID=1268548 RepID=UPI0013C2E443|nr:class I lanthipeptide [Taibaiella koreensis]
MKKKSIQFEKKLALGKQEIAQLSDRARGRVIGGATDSCRSCITICYASQCCMSINNNCWPTG